MTVGLAWLAAIVASERLAGRILPSRATGWMVVYGALGAAALLLGASIRPGDWRSADVMAGAVLAAAGYPLGRRLLGDIPDRFPPDPFNRELGALALVVAPAEELIWGSVVEPRAGLAATALLFAMKHPLVDGRWRRIAGLAAFWLGLGLVRADAPVAAVILHCGLNAAAVWLGHARRIDLF